MQMRRRILVSVILVSLIIGPAVAVRAESAGINVMVLPGTTGLSLVKLLEDQPGLGGVAADYSVIKTPELMTARIIAGEADIAALPTNTAAILYNKGVAVQLAAVTNWGVNYVIGRDASVRTWADLKGKDLALTGRGATPEILFRHFAAANGVNPDADVRVQYCQTAAELTQLALAGRADLAVLPEPWVTEALRKDPSLKVLLDFQAEWRRLEKRDESYPQSCLVIRADLAKTGNRAVQEFLRLAAEASDWVNAHPSEAGRLAEKYVQISAEAARDAIPRCNLRFVEASRAQAEIDYYLRRLFAFDPQSVGGRLPDARFYLAK